MRQLLTLFFLLLAAQFCFARGKHASAMADTTRYTWVRCDSLGENLPKLSRSKDSLHFRYWHNMVSVDVWTNDYQVFYGGISCYTRSCDAQGGDRGNQLYFGKKDLDTATGRKIYELFIAHGIFDLPAGSSIKRWPTGLDGDTYGVDYHGVKGNWTKWWWTPRDFKDSIKEAAIVDTVVNSMEVMLHLYDQFDLFIKSLPPGSYSAGGYVIACNNCYVRKKRGKKGGN